ncbi:hypothetical protein [Enterococcus hermanniensis]|uniref:Uncharacterized protein n=1 Tax=Enterococcus hermanniensis TaxID=249189 RepID=A0A1L8TRF5_9ENTE|nr:hypothetical protein [Enterococcus hermanniensis]OJG46813.1 hypothetical protein RV04_GL000060 [Enterococcus hermanniensis]
MKVLFVFDDQKNSSFFVYDLSSGINSLLRVSPEIKIKNVTLGELYTQVPIEKFLAYFSVAFSIEVKKYLVLKKADSLLAIKEAGLEADGKLPVTIYKDFVAQKNNQHFTKGAQRLSLAEVDAYISYQIDEDGQLDVFERQEDIIRLMKRKTVKPRLSSITNNFGTVKEYSGSNLNLKDMLKMGTGYLAKGNARMNKINVPANHTFTVSNTAPYRLATVDWSKNEIKLRADLYK